MTAGRILHKPLLTLVTIVLIFSTARGAEVQRTSLVVQNLFCSSCSAAIEAELRGLAGTTGVEVDPGRRMVTVDHEKSLAPGRIAEFITRMGYPARIIPAPASAASLQKRPIATGIGANSSRRNCPAAAAAWKELYWKLVGKTPNP